MRKILLVSFCALMLSAPATFAAEEWGWKLASTFTDVFIARPFTFAATAIGAGVWAATLPITLPTKTSKDAFEVMVKDPWIFTVDRPLGEFEE